MDAAPCNGLELALKIFQALFHGIRRWVCETQLPQDVVKPEEGSRKDACPFIELRQAIACVQVQARAFTLQSLSMTPPKQRCRQGVDVPGMHFLKLDQPFGGQHPACTAADQHQLTAWHGLR